MDNEIFRKKSIERISSPEELNDYLRVSNIRIWMILVSIVVLLAGFIVWASTGTIETTAEALVVADSENISVYVSGAKAEMIREGMVVKIDAAEYPLQDLSVDEYDRSVSHIIANLPQGKYQGEVIIERIRPLSFLLK